MPVGKSQVAFLSVEQWGNSSFTAERFPPSQAGFGVSHPPACGYLLVSPPSLLPACVGVVEGAVLAFPPLFQDFQARELLFFLELAQPRWEEFRSHVTWGPLDAGTQRKLQ